jgi:hypothetical protein
VLTLHRSQKQLTRDEVSTAFDLCFKHAYDQLVQHKKALEEKEISLRPSVISLYRLHCSTDLPSEITLHSDPDKQQKQIEELLEHSKFSQVVYPLPMQHYRSYNSIVSLSDWSFLDSAMLSKLKEEFLLSKSPESGDIEKIIETVLQAPREKSVVKGLSKWVRTRRDRLRANSSPNQADPSRWATLLIPALHKVLARSPQLLDKLVHLEAAFNSVRNQAASLGLTDRLLTTGLISHCAIFVDKYVIDLCNEELSALGLALTKSMKVWLHEMMLQYLVSSQANYRTQQIDKILDNFNKPKLGKVWKLHFMEQVLRGPDRDAKAVDNLIDEFSRAVLVVCVDNSRKKTDLDLAEFKKNLSRYKMQFQVEQNLNAMTPEMIMHYIEDTPYYIARLVYAESKQKEEVLIAEARKIFHMEADCVRDLAQWLHGIVGQLGPASAKASDIFRAEEDDAKGVLTRKEAAAALLLQDIVKRNLYEKSYDVGGSSLDVVVKLSIREAPPSAASQTKALLAALQELYYISDLFSFLSILWGKLEELADQLDSYQCEIAQLDTTNTLQQIRENAGGCTQMCPCCARFCDEDHTEIVLAPIGSGENRHKCRVGHQYRALAGVSHYKTKFASLQLCQTMKDTDMIWFKDHYVQWHEYKASFPEWSFHFPSHAEREAIESAESRMALIWNTIGREMSNKYLLCQKICLKFI